MLPEAGDPLDDGDGASVWVGDGSGVGGGAATSTTVVVSDAASLAPFGSLVAAAMVTASVWTPASRLAGTV